MGLSLLLKDSSFFVDDLSGIPVAGTLSMLDLTVEVVCTRFEFSTDSQHEILLQFVKLVISKSQGSLSHVCLQYMYKALFFMSAYASSKWVKTSVAAAAAQSHSYNRGNDGAIQDETTAANIVHELLWAIVTKPEDIGDSDIRLRLPDSTYTFQYLKESELHSASEVFMHSLLLKLLSLQSLLR